MQTRTYYIFGCILIGTISVILLTINTKFNIHTNSDFIRRFPPHFLIHQTIFNYELKGSYIAGMDDKTLYLGYTNEHSSLGRFQWNQNHLTKSKINLNDSTHIAWKVLKVHILQKKVFLIEGLTPNSFTGSLDTNGLMKQQHPKVSFTDGLPISPNRMVIKTMDRFHSQQVLGLVKDDGAPLFIPELNLKKQVDGFFCVDGDLCYNEASQRIIYTYRYRNEFLIFDKELLMINTFHTIDPQTEAKIKVSSIKKDGVERFKLAAPPLIVNKKSYSQGSWLFVNSNLPAKNEDQSKFQSKSVIDIYGFQSGHYRYSFYIPSYKGHLMKDFAYYNNTLVVLYDQGILIFKMDLLKA